MRHDPLDLTDLPAPYERDHLDQGQEALLLLLTAFLPLVGFAAFVVALLEAWP